MRKGLHRARQDVRRLVLRLGLLARAVSWEERWQRAVRPQICRVSRLCASSRPPPFDAAPLLFSALLGFAVLGGHQRGAALLTRARHGQRAARRVLRARLALPLLPQAPRRLLCPLLRLALGVLSVGGATAQWWARGPGQQRARRFSHSTGGAYPLLLLAREQPLVLCHGLGLAVALAKVRHAVEVLVLQPALLRLCPRSRRALGLG